MYRQTFFRSEKQVSLCFVYMTVFVDVMGESLVLPILGQFAVYFGKPVALAGLLFSATALAMTASNLWLPVFADRHGRRAAFLVSLIGSTVGYAGQATARTFYGVVFFRTVQGLFGGVPPVALARLRRPVLAEASRARSRLRTQGGGPSRRPG